MMAMIICHRVRPTWTRPVKGLAFVAQLHGPNIRRVRSHVASEFQCEREHSSIRPVARNVHTSQLVSRIDFVCDADDMIKSIFHDCLCCSGKGEMHETGMFDRKHWSAGSNVSCDAVEWLVAVQQNVWTWRFDSHPITAGRRVESRRMHTTQGTARAARVHAACGLQSRPRRGRQWVVQQYFSMHMISWFSIFFVPVSCGAAICKLRQDTGPCRGLYNRFAFDSERSQCVAFTYGGCRGNQNNFLVKEECEATCQRTGTISSSTQSPRRSALRDRRRLIENL